MLLVHHFSEAKRSLALNLTAEIARVLRRFIDGARGSRPNQEAPGQGSDSRQAHPPSSPGRLRGSDLGPVIHINGKPIGNIKKGFAAACRRAGLEGVTPHTLRHTAASWLMQSGTEPLKAARYLAMSEKTLVNTYGHHAPDWLRDAANAIGRPQPRRGIGA